MSLFQTFSQPRITVVSIEHTYRDRFVSIYYDLPLFADLAGFAVVIQQIHRISREGLPIDPGLGFIQGYVAIVTVSSV